MLKLESLSAQALRPIGVLTDIDDTLTTEGAITPDALQALTDLKAAGLHVVPITGRPVGWSEPFVSQWPVDAIVAENGAVALLSDPANVLRKIYQEDAATRERNFERMQAVGQRLLREVPGAQLSQDHEGRETDIAIDHSEFTHMPQSAIEAVVRIMQRRHDRHREQHPHQRLVWRTQQTLRCPLDRAHLVGPGSGR